MKLRYTRREILRLGAGAVPALHFGFGPSTLMRALAGPEERANRFRKLRLITNPDQLEGMRRFYEGVLNMPLIGDDSASLSFQAGRTQLGFHADPAGGSPFYHFAFNIPENKLDEAIAWLSGRTPLLKGRQGNHIVYFDWLDAHSVYFYDPAGNLLEFIAHHPLKNGRSGNFDVEDILYASEIGLVTEDVPGLSAELDTKLGLKNYAVERHQPISDVFRPIGDPYGFFIVVRHKRVWLMTDDPAGMYPVSAALRGPSSQELRLENCVCELSIGQ